MRTKIYDRILYTGLVCMILSMIYTAFILYRIDSRLGQSYNLNYPSIDNVSTTGSGRN